MTLWLLEVTIYGDDWDDLERYWFLTEASAKEFKLKYDNEHKDENGKYIPTISNMYYNIMSCEYDEVKDILTIEDYENLFNVNIGAPMVWLR